MNLSQNLNVQLSQKLVLSQEMLQSLELIQLPVLELKEKIEQEVMENPALEIIEKVDSRKEFSQKEKDLDDEVFDERDRYFCESNNNIYSSYRSNSSDDDDDSKRMFLEGAFSFKEGLHDKLRWQLNLSHMTEEQKEIGETIISYIDSNGFFKEDLMAIFPDNTDEALEVLENIQMFDPPGVATADVREALLYQLESLPEDNVNETAYEIVRDYFHLVLERKDVQLARAMGISIDEIKKAFVYLTQFELYPGRAYDNSADNYIVPDAIVYMKDGELQVEINNEVLPELTISEYMEKIAKIAKEKHAKDEKNKFILEKVASAKKFIEIIRNRNNSLFKVILAIVQAQKEFFRRGSKYLVPLIMKDIAEEVGLAESTISRLTSSKYIQTEWGIHELKYFFTNAIKKKDGDVQSSESVREMIKEIIEENVGKKISDQKIADILQTKGIHIARRTVAKYRNILNILPSAKRNI